MSACEKDQPKKADPAPAPQPAPSADPLQQYGINDFVSECNNLAQQFGIAMHNPKVYQDATDFIVFSIPVTNGNGVGITVNKKTGNYTNLALVGSVPTQQAYISFFDAIAVILKQIDPQLSNKEIADILANLGEGKQANQINQSLSFEKATLTTNYDAQARQLIFQYASK
jgi:hypothetical protein